MNNALYLDNLRPHPLKNAYLEANSKLTLSQWEADITIRNFLHLRAHRPESELFLTYGQIPLSQLLRSHSENCQKLIRKVQIQYFLTGYWSAALINGWSPPLYYYHHHQSLTHKDFLKKIDSWFVLVGLLPVPVHNETVVFDCNYCLSHTLHSCITDQRAAVYCEITHVRYVNESLVLLLTF